MQDSFDFFAVVAIPIAFGCMAAGASVMALVGGEPFRESGLLLAVLGPACAIVFFGALSGHAIVALKKQKIMTFGYLLVAAITITGYFVFIPRYGMWAAAILTLVSESLILLLTGVVVYRTSKFVPNLKTFLRARAASVAMYLAVRVLSSFTVFITIPVGILVYVGVLMAIGGPSLKTVVRLFVPEKPPIITP
jgi:O-antigen/teichoic acid export membrane protein